MRVDPASVQAHISPSARVAESTIVKGCGTLTIDDFGVIEDHVLIDLGKSGQGVVRLGLRTKLKYGAVLRCYNGRIEIGSRTTVGEYTVIAAHGGVTIGSDVGIAGHCTIAASNHIRVLSETPIRYQGETAKGIQIGNGVWIATGVRVLDGVCVNDGAAVGAGAVVNRSLPPRHLCVGVPCRPVRELDPLHAHLADIDTPHTADIDEDIPYN